MYPTLTCSQLQSLGHNHSISDVPVAKLIEKCRKSFLRVVKDSLVLGLKSRDVMSETESATERKLMYQHCCLSSHAATIFAAT